MGGNVKFFLQRRILYSWLQKSPVWIEKLSSNYLHLNQVDICNGFRDIIKFFMKSSPSWKSGEITYLSIGHRLGKPLVHTDHMYMNLYFFSMQIWWFQLKSVMSYRADRVKFMDGWTDRRTDAGNDNSRSAWKAKGQKRPQCGDVPPHCHC